MSLADLEAAGYVTEDWKRWQQGNCGGYAAAMIQSYPGLRLGGLDFWGEGWAQHFVAHDDTHAYDSAGIHLLPYRGVDGGATWMPDIGDLDEHGLTETYGECGDYTDEERAAVLAHATRNRLTPDHVSR